MTVVRKPYDTQRGKTPYHFDRDTPVVKIECKPGVVTAYLATEDAREILTETQSLILK